jgi:hypothetical protein
LLVAAPALILRPRQYRRKFPFIAFLKVEYKKKIMIYSLSDVSDSTVFLSDVEMRRVV